MRRLTLAYILCFVFTTVAPADANLGLIYGRVLIAGTNLPVCPITVTVTSDREPPQKTTTSADGHFHFLAVSPGTVAVTVGKSRAVRYLTISANIVNFDLILQPFYLLPIVTLQHASASQTHTIEQVCRGRNRYFSGYGYSDYDPSP